MGWDLVNGSIFGPSPNSLCWGEKGVGSRPRNPVEQVACQAGRKPQVLAGKVVTCLGVASAVEMAKQPVGKF